MEIRYTAKARIGLAEIEEFIAQDSPAKAKAFIERPIRAIDRLRRFPQSGTRLIRDISYRQAVFYRYRVVYRIDGDRVVIVAVIVPGRELEAVLDFDEDRP
jgi:plasmid stabilization system protein ParE